MYVHIRVFAYFSLRSRWQDSNLWPSVPKTDALTRLRYTSSPHPGAYRSTRSMKTQTELAHPFGHRDARTNPSNPPLFFRSLQQDRARRCKPYSAGALTFFGLLFHLNFQIRLRVLWTLRPLRSGFEPLTQGFSVLCSNQLSYLNHFPKVCFLHRIAPYLTTWLVREKPLTNKNI